MKTLNKIKSNNMKNRIVVIVMAIMLMPALSMAQDIFEKYNDNSDVTYVSIKPKMFQMIAKMGINVDDPEAKSDGFRFFMGQVKKNRMIK